MGEACGHFAKRGHFRALVQLHPGAAHIRVITADGLNLDQRAVLVEYSPVGPDPPGILTAGQLDTDFFGAHRRLRGELTNAPNECLALLVRKPVPRLIPVSCSGVHSM